MPWSTPLTWPITMRDGAVLRTLEDAGRALAEMSADRQKHEWVLHAARLLMTAAETGGEDEIEDATRQVERALTAGRRETARQGRDLEKTRQRRRLECPDHE